MYRQGDIVLVPFPFDDDLTRIKRRPVIIISKQSSNVNSYIVAKITSVNRNNNFSFPFSNSDIDFSLDYPSEIRINEIMTINNTLVVRKLGELKRETLIRLLYAIKKNFELS